MRKGQNAGYLLVSPFPTMSLIGFKTYGKRRKFWSLAFPPFPAIFSELIFFLRVLKNRYSEVKG